MKETLITPDMVQAAKTAGACKSAIKWLREKPRTLGDLIDHNPEWVGWATFYVPGLFLKQRIALGDQNSQRAPAIT